MADADGSGAAARTAPARQATHETPNSARKPDMLVRYRLPADAASQKAGQSAAGVGYARSIRTVDW